MTQAQNETVLGQITSVFGVKGWLKVYSYTDPISNILNYRQWILLQDGARRTVKVSNGRIQGKGLVAQLDGVDDPDQARLLCGAEIRVSADALPALPEGEYYWHQLEGLAVYTAEGQRLGRVDHLIETGANDVMVIEPDAESIDQRQRLVPYLPEDYVQAVDLEAGRIEVHWDPEF